MRKILLLILLMCCVCVFCIGRDSYAFISTTDKVKSIKSALARSLCFEKYWEWSDYKINSVLPIKIAIIGKDFHIWINDFEVSRRAHMAGYFEGKLRNDKAVIIRTESYNIGLIPSLPGYQKNKKLFENQDVIEDSLIVPSNCSPYYDVATAQKELMLRTVTSTVQKQLNSWHKQGIVKYPRELTLIIADFNIDYSSTYILVEETKKLYSVTLHDPQSYESDEYERIEEYPFGEIYNKSKSLLGKIRKHGIIRKIMLNP